MYKIPDKPKIELKTRQPDKRHFAVVPISVLNKNITAGQYKTLIALASYCNKAGYSYVSLEKIGQDLGISKQAVNKHMNKLEAAGIVKTFKNHYAGIKGATRRIIYSENISDKEAAAIAGEPAEPYTHKEINTLLKEKYAKKNNSLQRASQSLAVDQSSLSDNEIIASLKTSVSTPLEKAMIQRDFEAGIPLDIIKRRYIKG